jgi:putative Mg2+ transporter-C (MgtC) family protein
MPITIDWPEIILRLALAIIAGTLLGLNRTERGMAAGLRTTLLVCLAAAVSMIQVNLLLDTAGKPTGSLVTLDLMRLPLGVLTGMGFIGGGAIRRRGSRVRGITTAATLWFATILGLCFGGGQHGLGLIALVLGIIILGAMRRLEAVVPQEHRGTLSLSLGEDGPGDEEIRTILESGDLKVASWDTTYTRKGDAVRRQLRCEVHWHAWATAPTVPQCIRKLVGMPGIRVVRWRGDSVPVRE